MGFDGPARTVRCAFAIRDAVRSVAVLVEYDTDRGNAWVPFPVSFRSWTSLAVEAGFRDTRRIASVRSRFLGSIYSVMSLRWSGSVGASADGLDYCLGSTASQIDARSDRSSSVKSDGAWSCWRA